MTQPGGTAAGTVLVVGGVSGTGKSTVAEAVARRLGWPILEGDSVHPSANIAKMSRGEPLTDQDRTPWLLAIADWIGVQEAEHRAAVVTCSALKRRYRDLLRNGHPDVRFVLLTAPPEVLAERMSHRRGHFMPVSLLDSQLASFEPLEPDEPGALVSVDQPPEAVLTEVLGLIGRADRSTG